MISWGNSSISKIYLGDTEVQKMYLGNDLIYSAEQPATGYTLTFTANAEGDAAYVYYKTSQDQSGTLNVQIDYGQTQTIQDCTAFKVVEDSSAYCNSISGTASPALTSGADISIDAWYSLQSAVTIDATCYI